jgi:hypothetical protein
MYGPGRRRRHKEWLINRPAINPYSYQSFVLEKFSKGEMKVDGAAPKSLVVDGWLMMIRWE